MIEYAFFTALAISTTFPVGMVEIAIPTACLLLMRMKFWGGVW